ncbi:ankyrin [Aspergillus flavus]|nr:ankyrin [Aspergillus flavus]
MHGRTFGSESRCLTAQFEAQKLRLQNWGEAVGVEQESVSSKHHELLDDPRTRSNIQNLLLAVKDICGHEQALSLTTISRAETGSSEGPILREHVILLLERDAYVEVKDIDEWTPLMNASFEGHAEVVKALSERGADIEAKSANGQTALMYATTQGHIEVVRLLLQRGANIEAKTDIGVTPLMFASSFGHIEVVKLLLKHGADLTNRDITGTTSLHVAAYDGHVKVVEIFLQASSTHVDALNRLNRTPLFQAAARGHLCVVNTLLSHKANAKIKDHYRSTPLLIAVRNGHKDVVGRLITLADSSIHFQNGSLGKRHNIEAIESDLQVDGSLVKLGEPSRYCDVCIRDLRANEVYYKFKTCFDFNICSECF